MMRLTLLVLATLMLASSSFAQDYAWTISTSSADPDANVGTISGLGNVYLWLRCSNSPTVGGMSSAEFRLQATDLVILDATARDGFIRDTSVDLPDLILRADPGGTCPAGPIAVASLVVTGSGGGVCFAPSSANGLQITLDCQSTPIAHEFNWVGLDNGGGSCSQGSLCNFNPVSVEGSSWGSLKGLYR